ncbi:MAG: hypothetical protein WBX22_09610 [Silvibacterium sp.]
MGRRGRQDRSDSQGGTATGHASSPPSAVIGDVEALIAASETAITSNGLNFPADSQLNKEFVTLIADFKQLTPAVEQA